MLYAFKDEPIRPALSAGGMASGAAERSFSVSRGSGGCAILSVKGRMPHGWVVRLASGIAAAGVGIVKGEARRITPLNWQAEFELKPVVSGVDPETVNFDRLVRTEAPRTSDITPLLESFSYRPPEQPGGSLYVEVRAKDRTGFLGAILSRFSFFSLFPEEMVIQTTGGMIHDRFWLKGGGGISPSEDAMKVLVRNLEGLLDR